MTAVAEQEKVQVHGNKWSLARAVSQYDAADPIWKDPRNADLEVVAEFHTWLVGNMECYRGFWKKLEASNQQSDFVTKLVLAVRGVPNPLALLGTLLRAGADWSTEHHFAWKDGFGPMRDLLRTDHYRARYNDLDAKVVARYRAQILVKTRAV